MSYLRELGIGLAWRPWDRILMLWHYLEESGEHFPASDGGGLRRLTIAGGMAPLENWEALAEDWGRMLDDFEIRPMFHMTDFEAWRSPFDFRLPNGERDRDKHNRLINRALDIIIEHVHDMVGFVAEPERGKQPFSDAYETNLAQVVKTAYVDTFKGGEPVTMVFAKHKDFKAARIGRYFDLWDDGNGRLKFGGIGEPLELPPLQVADIIAYEASRSHRDSRPEQERYPLRRLKEAFAAKQPFRHARLFYLSTGQLP